MSPPVPPSPPESFWRAIYRPVPLTAAAVVAGWAAVWLAFRGHPLSIAGAILTTALALTAVVRGRAIARDRAAELRDALADADARNEELERLRQLSASFLGGRTLQDVFDQIVQASADLLRAESSTLMLVVEEGRYLRVAAAIGPARRILGILLPVDGSLAGHAVSHDRALVTDDMDADPRSYSVPGLSLPVRAAAMVPLRSAGVIIGTICVYNRLDQNLFDARSVQLLQALGDQAAVALDRAQVLEEIRRNEQTLAERNRELQRATRLKDEFLANVSHELRTPLNAIIGFSDLLMSGELGAVPEQHREFLDAILRNGRHLLRLINSVLDLSKIDAGRMILDLGATDLREAIASAVSDTESLRMSKRQTCQVELASDALTILADPVRVRQILFNLLANASKFTPDGGHIRLAAVRTWAPLPVPGERAGEIPALRSREAVWVSVIDNGIGIRAEDMPKLFREFSQVDSSASRRQQGSGLGLVLSKKFVEMHDGAIGAESIFGKGSTFWFLLPTEGPVRRSPPPALAVIGEKTADQ